MDDSNGSDEVMGAWVPRQAAAYLQVPAGQRQYTSEGDEHNPAHRREKINK
jgi:hypothetical protein